jgi:hypothetical protein
MMLNYNGQPVPIIPDRAALSDADDGNNIILGEVHGGEHAGQYGYVVACDWNTDQITINALGDLIYIDFDDADFWISS